MLEIGVCAEAEALGCKIRYTADGPPHVEEPLIKELGRPGETLACPTPSGRFRSIEMLKTTRIVKRETGGKVYINGRSDQGPIALAFALVGPQRFLTMLMDPELNDWCRRLLAFCSRVNIALGEAQLRAGADSSTIGLAGVSLISPALFDAFELPGARAFCAAMQRSGGFAFVHACGDETLYAGEPGGHRRGLPGVGPGHRRGNVQARGARPSERARHDRSGAGDAFRHAGRRAPPGDAKCWPRWAPGGGFIIGPGCALPADTPVENVQTLMECARREGVYDAEGRPRAKPSSPRFLGRQECLSHSGLCGCKRSRIGNLRSRHTPCAVPGMPHPPCNGGRHTECACYFLGRERLHAVRAIWLPCGGQQLC